MVLEGKKIQFIMKLLSIMTPCGEANFVQRTIVWNIFEEVHLVQLSSRPYGFWQEDLYPYISLYKIRCPRGGANIDPGTIIWTILAEVTRWCYTKYLSSRLNCFWQEEFFSFPYIISLHKIKLRLGLGQYLPWGYIFLIVAMATRVLNEI